MKNFTKIFFAVVAGIFAFSCTTDTTEDLGVKVEGQGGVYEVAISLEASRTQLGEKADGNYPLYWSEGDAIAINGVASNPLTAGGASNAVFSFNQEVARPFCVVYPATEGAGEGTVYPVTFAATQPYTVGTFASGVAPMYGYAAELAEGDVESAVQLNHLTGVLRFAIKGEATLSSIAITAEKPIAGPFTVDCANGTLTAGAEATNTVTVTFGEGLALGAEATPIYVAVPAGSHGLFNIVITSATGESMTAKYNSEDKPVNVGVVKEFGEILFVPTVAEAPQGELIITNETDMKRLSTWAENGMLAEVTSVKVAGNIDMSKISNWAPIVNFPAITFDGGSEQGYEISNLTTSLFADLDGATIKNVKITDANATETALLHFGLLANNAKATAFANCYVAGALTYNGSTAITGSVSASFAVGGMVGAVTGASSITDCITDVNINIKKYAASADAKAYQSVAGIVGYISGTSTANIEVKNSTSLGTIVSNAKNVKNIQPSIGGIAGQAYYTKFTNVTNGEAGDNTKGDITIAVAIGCTCTGGLIGACKDISIYDSNNYGTIYQNASIGYPYIGGVLGSWWTNGSNGTYTLESVNNYGDVIVKEGITNDNGTPFYGGIVGRHNTTNGTTTFKDCTNNGAVSIKANFNLKEANHMIIGGIVGGCVKIAINNCDNKGAIFQHGTLNTNKPTWNSETKAFTHTTYLYLGGIAGKAETSCTMEYCDNSGAISIDTDTIYGYIGGVVGGAAVTSFKNNTNSGNITVAGSFNLNTGICGLGASIGCATINCSNSGNITVSATQPQGDDYTNADGKASKATGTFYICGIAWVSDYAHQNFTNSGNITFTGDTYVNVFMSGAVYTPKKTIKNICNTGDIIADVNSLHATLKMGGLARSSTSGTYDSCSNSGDIVFKGTTTASVYMGGLAADIDGAFKTAGTGFVNTGAIKWLGYASKSGVLGGIAGGATVAVGTITTLKNEGLVTNYDAETGLIGTAKSGIYLGGCIAFATKVAQTVAMENTGTVYVRNVAEGNLAGIVYAGGIVGSTALAFSNAKVDCDVAGIGLVEVKDKVGVGMVTGIHRGSTALVDKCKVGGRYALTETDGQPDWLIITPKVYGTTDASEEFIPSDGYVPFWKKIYGGDWADAHEGNCDNCTYESANVPVEPTSL